MGFIWKEGFTQSYKPGQSRLGWGSVRVDSNPVSLTGSPKKKGENLDAEVNDRRIDRGKVACNCLWKGIPKVIDKLEARRVKKHFP